MLNGIRRAAFLIIGCLIGYALGSGPYSEWIGDLYNQLALAWTAERIARGPSGTLPLLIAGFLIGQGLFLLARSIGRKIGPMRTERAEHLSAWDPGMRLASRFGLHKYLQRCAEWATEDPTARTQCLALFKVRGLGAVNEKNGTVVGSDLLRHIAAELRAASLPDNVGQFRRWLHQNFPTPSRVSSARVPPPRYPARWSGATFALAFRELDAVQAVGITRDLFNWIRKEFDGSHHSQLLSVTSVIVVGSPGVTARGLTQAATASLDGSIPSERVMVLCDPADVRGQVISEMNDVEFRSVSLSKRSPDEPPIPQKTTDWRSWLRAWGPALGCLATAFLLLRLTSGKDSTQFGYFPFPPNLVEVPVLDQAGSRVVHLVRSPLADQQANTWRVSDGLIVQGDPQDGSFAQCQVRVKISNNSKSSFYVSVFDFRAVDSNGTKLELNPQRMLRMEKGLTGRWLGPNESFSGWLQVLRKDAPIVGLEFSPDRYTDILLHIDKDTLVTKTTAH